MDSTITNTKRFRAVNWDEDEKSLFRRVVQEFVYILNDTCSTSEANRRKMRAWQDIHKIFNDQNRRQRDINQLKIQWKSMKLIARTIAQHKAINLETTMNTCEEFTIPSVGDSTEQEASTSGIYFEEHSQGRQVPMSNITAKSMTTSGLVMSLSPLSSERNPVNIDTEEKKKFNDNKEFPIAITDDEDYLNSLLNHVKMLKNKEHRRRMQMIEEEHRVNTKILEERFKCAKLEREILEIKKARMELCPE